MRFVVTVAGELVDLTRMQRKTSSQPRVQVNPMLQVAGRLEEIAFPGLTGDSDTNGTVARRRQSAETYIVPVAVQLGNSGSANAAHRAERRTLRPSFSESA